jgi:hypothetical protein
MANFIVVSSRSSSGVSAYLVPNKEPGDIFPHLATMYDYNHLFLLNGEAAKRGFGGIDLQLVGHMGPTGKTVQLANEMRMEWLGQSKTQIDANYDAAVETLRRVRDSMTGRISQAGSISRDE